MLQKIILKEVYRRSGLLKNRNLILITYFNSLFYFFDRIGYLVDIANGFQGCGVNIIKAYDDTKFH